MGYPHTHTSSITAVSCGAVKKNAGFWFNFSGNYHWWNPFGGDVSFDLGSQDLLKALGCMVLSGPFLTGFTQVRLVPAALVLYSGYFCSEARCCDCCYEWRTRHVVFGGVCRRAAWVRLPYRSGGPLF